jgi:hypothetical protein
MKTFHITDIVYHISLSRARNVEHMKMKTKVFNINSTLPSTFFSGNKIKPELGKTAGSISYMC